MDPRIPELLSELAVSVLKSKGGEDFLVDTRAFRASSCTGAAEKGKKCPIGRLESMQWLEFDANFDAFQ